MTCDGTFTPKSSNMVGAKLVDQEEIWIDSCRARRLLSVKPGFMKTRKDGLEKYRREFGVNGGAGNGIDEPLNFACLFPRDKIEELLTLERYHV